MVERQEDHWRRRVCPKGESGGQEQGVVSPQGMTDSEFSCFLNELACHGHRDIVRPIFGEGGEDAVMRLSRQLGLTSRARK